MKKKTTAVLSLIAFCLLTTTVYGVDGKTNANAFWSGGGLSYSKYAKLKYYTSRDVTDLGYIGYVNDALNEFDSISNADIGFVKSTGSESWMQIVVDEDNGSEYARDAYGYMSPWKIDPQTTAYVDASNYEPWDKTKVWLNDWVMNQYNFTPEQKNKTVIHEIGHVFAMDHQLAGVASVMVQGQLSYPDLKTLDIQNIQWKY
ncbi:hypothetical protein P9G84_31245 [Brevibacillus centrosporus]|uniref:hypothetical protein n=1 Tax=Brevibacillus centrosporus TaxID=54910 RepID=UPI0011415A2A|nr:hypothetical protein [Brevibacillus centrosporus]MEC2133334.1 hypothetical protein [Brevibacillus centrosporus]GED33909.1 hypothetical protein BCE02nite_50500 [Brevibacillus centrosporus]